MDFKKYITALIMTAALLSCGSDNEKAPEAAPKQVAPAEANDSPLVGAWTGPAGTRFEDKICNFRADGHALITDLGSTPIMEGSWETKGTTFVLHTPERDEQLQFRFSGDTLVLSNETRDIHLIRYL